ncbi:hypothetical protein E2C01_102706 [Portunus trituberculatus]|uniref:Uncharacterized protein n=1 Tax=Portunus trituberculatus TaxID=210409 RepID=A0A5B7KPR7_PORTR|nr:hypothetical protein [Portunus trituberculatus]
MTGSVTATEAYRAQGIRCDVGCVKIQTAPPPHMMINAIWHACAVPLDLPGTRREASQMCPYCRREMMATVQTGSNGK